MKRLTERERFERWIAKFCGYELAFIRSQRCDDNAYVMDTLDWAWAAWQQRARLARRGE